VASLVAGAGLAAGVAYLAWRVVTFGGAPWWLGVPTLAVEVIGWLATAVTVWALRGRPVLPDPPVATRSHATRSHAARSHAARSHAARSHAVAPTGDATGTVEIVVRCLDERGPASTAALRATLLSARPIAPVVVVDRVACPERAALAAEHGARYVTTDAHDLDGTVAAAGWVDAPCFVLLDAGDVAHPGIVGALAPFLDDPTVAVVQGMVTTADQGHAVGSGHSAEHGTGGRHDLEFERAALHPSLGARGLAPFTGSGALVRTDALRDLDTVESSSPMVRADVTVSLFLGGWRIVAPAGPPLVVVGTMSSPAEVEEERAREASAARHVLLGPRGAWRPNRLTPSQRLALTATAVRPLAGIRRSVVVVLLLGALLAGRLPFTPDPVVLGLTWVPWFVLSAWGLHLLSGGRLRPGDRVRWSMRMLGASWRGALAPDGRPDPAEHVIGGVFGLHHGVMAAAAVGAISVVIGMRALSDRVTHTLAGMPLDHIAVLLVVALWLLAGSLDALRVLAHRVQMRRATRVASSLPSTFADGPALVVDLTPFGAGVLADQEVGAGSEQRLDVVVPTASGVVSAVLPATVRNARRELGGDRRYGVEFGAVESYVADALVEYCMVQPALEALGVAAGDRVPTGARPVTVLDDGPDQPRRLGLRAAALVAVAGAIAAAVPGSEAAAGPPGGRVSGVVAVAGVDAPVTSDMATSGTATSGTATSDSLPGPAGAVVVVVCSIDAGADAEWGTSDDRFGPATSVVVGVDGRWELSVDGRVCWAAAAPPPGLMVAGETSAPESPTTPVALDLRPGAGHRVEFVRQAPAADAAAPAGGDDPGTTVVVDDVVWFDADGDGTLDAGEAPAAGVTLTLIDDLGVVRGSDVSGPDGSFRIEALSGRTHRLVATNLPDGWVTPDVLGRSAPFVLVTGTDVNLAVGLVPVDAARTSFPALGPLDATGDGAGGRLVVAPDGSGGPDGSGAAVVGGAPGSEVVAPRLLAEPTDAALGSEGRGGSPVWTWVVVALGTLIGLSVLAGSLRPRRVRRLVQSASSPDFAIK
jgi:hypothetical protein